MKERDLECGPLHGCFFVLCSLMAFVTGCQNTQPSFAPVPPKETGAQLNRVPLTNRFDPDWLKPPTNLYTIGPGDRLEIEVIGDPASRTASVVAPDGKIYFNLLAGIDVWGLTLAQAKSQIESELANYMREQPQVSLVLRGVESKRIWI